jgi:hypothetical protein
MTFASVEDILFDNREDSPEMKESDDDPISMEDS